MQTRTVSTTYTQFADGSSQWGSDEQPFADRGIHIQFRSFKGYVACEAVVRTTGELVASASHPALTYDDVRTALR